MSCVSQVIPDEPLRTAGPGMDVSPPGADAQSRMSQHIDTVGVTDVDPFLTQNFGQRDSSNTQESGLGTILSGIANNIEIFAAGTNVHGKLMA